VQTPPPESIFVTKLYRSEVQDREDMVLLWKWCGLAGADDVVERFEAAYPHAPDDPYLAGYVQAIIDDATD
jgi:hypothetical protein